MSFTKKNKVLGEDGGTYKFMIYLLPIIPIGVFSFVWYMWSKNLDMFVSSFIAIFALVFLYQTYVVICFLKVAGRTVFKIKIQEKGVDIELFSGRRVQLAFPLDIQYFGSRDIKHASKLFPKSAGFMQINTTGETFFISPATDDFSELREKLECK
jgi:hypothetical protein